MTLFFIYLAGLVLVLVVAFLTYRYATRPFLQSLNLKVLLIRVPQKNAQDEKGGKEFLEDINLSEQIFNSLSSLRKPFVFEVSVHNTGEEIYFYLAVPRESVGFAKRQVQGLFLNASVEDVNDYNIFNKNGSTAAAYLQLSENDVLPLRSYRENEADTFAPILSTLSKLVTVGDGASIQYMFSPAGDNYKKTFTGTMERLKKGEKFKDITNNSFLTLGDVRDALSTPDPSKENAPKIVDDESVKAIQMKASKPLYYMNVRIVTSSGTAEKAEEILSSITNAFSQFVVPFRNSFKIIRPKNIKNLIFDFIFREFDTDQSIVLNSEEIASIFHIPTTSSGVPNIKWLDTKEAPPPLNLPAEGVVIGESIFRGDHKLVRMTDNDRRRHLYVIGQTGVGKSYLILNMAEQDMLAGKGLCIIDPHGDLVDKVLSRVPKNRIDDVIVFDPGDLSRPLGLNMLEYDFNHPEEKTFIVNEMLSILDKLYDLKTTGGPMFELYMRNALLLLMEDSKNEPATLMELPRIFTDEEYRKAKLARISNPTVIDFWTKEAAKTSGEQGLANMTPYVTSKFNNFIANDYMRPIIGQTQSAFNFRKVMDDGKILLVNLSKGKIGDINASLLGMIFTGRILMAALSRGDITDEKLRRDFYLYVDEFQNFTTDSISVILSEARKYRLNLIIAHQFIAQLKDEIRESVFGNVGSMIAFRVGAPDTEQLVKQFGPEFSEKDLISIENQNAFAKMLIDGQPSRPFRLKMLRAEDGSSELRDKLKELSRLSHGQDLKEIEGEILERLR